DSLQDYLRHKQLLLVLDNFEQVADAAPLVGELLAGVPELKVLVTSRATLHLAAEHECPVPPLALPDPRQGTHVMVIASNPAVALFGAGAQATQPAFALTQANAAAVVAICRRLDGLPLAIELAAARIKLLSPQALLARLDQRFKVLTGGARDAPARQQTMRATIEWSYQLLDADEQTLFARLGVFVGGWKQLRQCAIVMAICPSTCWMGWQRCSTGACSSRKRGVLVSRASRCWRRSANMRWSGWRRAARPRRCGGGMLDIIWQLPSKWGR